jgi:carboxylesterase type B
MMSGTAFLLPAISGDPTHSNFSFVAKHVGCGDGRNASEELECMRQVPVKRLVNFGGRYNDKNNGSLPGLRFGPTADGKAVFENYTAMYAQGSYSGVPAIVSNAADEGAGLTTYPVQNVSAGPWQVAADQVTLAAFICPSHSTSVLRQESGSLTYRYQYAGNFSNVSPRGWMGAFHDSDLPLVMGTYNDFRPVEGAELEYQTSVSERMQDLVLAFMRNPAIGPKRNGWGGYGRGQILRFAGSSGEIATNVSVQAVDGVCSGAGTYDSSP